MISTMKTRDRIITSARSLFWRQGYTATGMATILSEADAGSGSLYHFFDGKDDLLAAVLERYLDRLDPEVVQPACASTDHPVEQVFAILAGYRRGLLESDFRFACPIGRIALEVTDPPEPVRALLNENFDAWCAAVETRLRGASDRFPEGTDFSGLARFILTVMEGGVMQSATARDIEPFDASVRHLRTYLDLLATAPG